jgi:CDP-diacylglycerol--serine O-phosphatidyltransferase
MALLTTRGRVRPRGIRRGAYLLPSLFTMANMFCGYACIIHAMRGDYATAAPYIGFAILLDMLDGRIARLTGSTSAFGVEFDSLADVISFGVAPAVLAFTWGLTPFGRFGWAAGFIFVAAAAIRLARFNIQTGGTHDKRYFVGMPSPAAAAVPAATVFAYPYGLQDWLAVLAMPVVLVPAFLMVSTIRYRSFKTFDLRSPRSYRLLIVFAILIAAVMAHPQAALVVLAYSYLASAFVGIGVMRLRRARDPQPVPAAAAESTSATGPNREAVGR